MSLLDHVVTAADGRLVSLQNYAGRVLLVVNTASRCVFTRQYAGLQLLHADLAGRGLAILAFPCDQFRRQEPGDDAEIQSFCRTNFALGFPVFAKTKVNGPDASPFFTELTRALPGLTGPPIRWNFTKFLIDRQGRPLCRIAPFIPPAAIRARIERSL